MVADHDRRDLEPAMYEVPLALVAAIPFVGSPLAQLIGGYRTSVQLRRLERFAESFRERLQRLEAQQALDQNYLDSDSYILYVLRAAEIAASAHREEHIEILANVAAGAGVRGTSDRWRDKFLQVAEAIGPDHVRLLRTVRDGEVWLWQRDDIGEARFLSDLIPDLIQDEQELLLRDLMAGGLVRDNGAGRYGVRAGEAWVATPVGLRFLDFLAGDA